MNTDGIKAVAFDVDGTLVDSSIWKALHARFGFSEEEDNALLEKYRNEQITFRDWMDGMHRVYVTADPLPRKAEVDAIFGAFTFIAGAEELVRKLSGRYPIALISSGFADYVHPVAEALSVRHAYAYTRMAYDEQGAYRGMECLSESDELTAKVDALNDFRAKIGAQPSEIAFVGDSVNDLGAFRHTGRGILIGDSRKDLEDAAWKRVRALPQVLDILTSI